MIAHQPTQPHQLEPGHNKYDLDYSLGQQQPDLVMPLAYPSKTSDRAETSEEVQEIGIAGCTLFILTMFSPHDMPAPWCSWVTWQCLCAPIHPRRAG